MSSTLHKIADKLTGKDKNNTVDNPQSSNYGPHSSAAANKVDPRVDSDLDGRNNPTSHVGGYGNTQSTGTYNSGTGVATTTGTHHSTNAGPHNSNLANKLDPRVDSDRDGRNDPTSHVGGYGNTQAGTTTGGAGYTGTTTSSINPIGSQTHHSTNAGPHDSNLANKLDPRVDSDRDGRNDPTSRVGGYGNTQAGTTGVTGTTTGYTTSGYNQDDPRSTNAGPHSSNLLNKLDPRVDSDQDGRNDPTSRVGGYGHTQNTTTTGYTGGATTGTQGYTGSSTTYDDPRSTNTGPHSSNLLNKLDPRVDSDQDGSNNPASSYGGQGQTQTGHTGINRY